MESMGSPKKPGATRAGILIASLLFALLLFLPCAWFAAYWDQLAAPPPGGMLPGAAPLSRPSGFVSLAPSGPGQTRTVKIQHTGGQVVTTINDGIGRMIVCAADPRPPSNALDVLGQSLCDRYNAWKCEQGNPHQPFNIVWSGGGSITYQILSQPNSLARTIFTMHKVSPHAPLPAYAAGTRAPKSSPRPAMRKPAHP